MSERIRERKSKRKSKRKRARKKARARSRVKERERESEREERERERASKKESESERGRERRRGRENVCASTRDLVVHTLLYAHLILTPYYMHTLTCVHMRVTLRWMIRGKGLSVRFLPLPPFRGFRLSITNNLYLWWMIRCIHLLLITCTCGG